MLSFNIPLQKPGTAKRSKGIESDMVRFYMEQKHDIDITKNDMLCGADILEDFISFLIERRIVLQG